MYSYLSVRYAYKECAKDERPREYARRGCPCATRS